VEPNDPPERADQPYWALQAEATVTLVGGEMEAATELRRPASHSRRAVSATSGPRSLAFYIVSFVVYVLLMYPFFAVVFTLEEVALGRHGNEAQFDLLVLFEEIAAVHWPSFFLAGAAAVLPAIVTHRLRASMAAALAQVQESNRKQREFISVVSHEFRTPLTAIHGLSELMSEDELPPEQVREFSRDINADAQRLERMITEILDFDRLESGRMVIAPKNVDLGAYVRGAVEAFRVVAPQHTFVSDVGGLSVKADPDKLAQILTNLLANATKYTPPGSTIMVRAAAEGAMTHVIVEDDGPGIPPNALERIFERYYRIESKDRPQVAGTGLGLPIVRQIVELHGGRVWCESEEGHGAAFHFTLPSASESAMTV
jgi:signal transduction histidine kinase